MRGARDGVGVSFAGPCHTRTGGAVAKILQVRLGDWMGFPYIPDDEYVGARGMSERIAESPSLACCGFSSSISWRV